MPLQHTTITQMDAAIAIYAPMIHRAPNLMRADPLRGQVGGVGRWK
jgi:hypothetical protein